MGQTDGQMGGQARHIMPLPAIGWPCDSSF